jgi:dGTPase
MSFMKNYIKEFEDAYLAPYAMKSRQSKGRLYSEKEHPYRSCYQRDRDRVIHCAAFRRLEYKTQVFVNHEGDYYRTRLTHTIEVAQIARTIAGSLRLNADLVEAIALAHDLGHTPFGHSGEEALDALMSEIGGFNHNRQGLRIVDLLEERYPEFPGLNLTWEVREGIARHSSFYDKSPLIEGFRPEVMPTLETQVVDIADEIAYNNHDIDDGLTSGLLEESGLRKVKLWSIAEREVLKRHKKIRPPFKKYQIVRLLIDMQVTDLIEETGRRIKNSGAVSLNDCRSLGYKLVAFSKEMESLRLPLKDFLMKNLYQNYRVVRMANKAKRFIAELFGIYVNSPEQLPREASARFGKEEDVRRVVCDYIAGMTDRQALDEYKKLFDPYEKV